MVKYSLILWFLPIFAQKSNIEAAISKKSIPYIQNFYNFEAQNKVNGLKKL